MSEPLAEAPHAESHLVEDQRVCEEGVADVLVERLLRVAGIELLRVVDAEDAKTFLMIAAITSVLAFHAFEFRDQILVMAVRASGSPVASTLVAVPCRNPQNH